MGSNKVKACYSPTPISALYPELIHKFGEPLYAYSIYKGIDSVTGVATFVLFKTWRDNTRKRRYHHDIAFTGNTAEECMLYAERTILPSKLASGRYGYGMTMTKTALRRNTVTTNRVTNPSVQEQRSALARITRANKERREFPERSYAHIGTNNDVSITPKISDYRSEIGKNTDYKERQHQAVTRATLTRYGYDMRTKKQRAQDDARIFLDKAGYKSEEEYYTTQTALKAQEEEQAKRDLLRSFGYNV